MISTYFVIFSFMLSISNAQQPQLRSLGSFSCPDAAFLHLAQLSPSDQNRPNSTTLFISSFDANPFGADFVYSVNDIDLQLNQFSSINPKPLTSSIVWPNTISTANINQFSNTSIVMAVAGGFLLPGKSTGAINLFAFNASSNENQPIFGPSQISVDDSEWFYHRTFFRDVDGDGFTDVIAARAIKPVIFGSTKGELIWYENPGSDEPPFGGRQWQEHHIVDGPDIFYTLYDIDGDGLEEIIATQFFTSKLVVYWTNTTWSDPNSVNSIIIDDTLGSPFDLQIVDVNNDGRNELLVTNHESTSNSSAVFAYEIPKNFKNPQNWIRHTLANNFPVRESGFNQAAPGNAVAVWPQPSLSHQTKPFIFLSGDGAQWVYLLIPNSSNSNDWTYKVTAILKTEATIGQIITSDIDGDGYSEVLVAVYDTGFVYGWTFSPKS